MTYTLAPFVTAEMLEKEGFVLIDNPFVYGSKLWDFTVRVLSNPATIMFFDKNTLVKWAMPESNPVRDWQKEYNIKVEQIYQTKLQDLILKGYVIANG